VSSPPADPIDLAAAAPIRLGALEVRPSTREVCAPGAAPTIAEPRVLQVLLALAQAQGQVVSRGTLIDRCWEGRVVGEDAIDRAIAKARRLADLTAPPAFVVETVPRVGYRLLVGEPSAVSQAPPAGPAFGRRSLIVGGGAGLAAIGAGAFVGYRALKARPKPDPLVAVLAFENLSPDPQMGYFAGGLSEDILDALVRQGGMRVIAGSSSFTFRGAAKAKAGQALGADYLLDGSVLRDGQRLRVNARLNDVATRQVLWSERYDRDLGQGLQIEDEVAAQVAAALKIKLSAVGALAAQAIDPVAYELYLKGRQATGVHTPESLQRGNALLRQAVERAPNFAAAWFELARNYWRNGYLEPLPDQQRGFELGRQAARRALALDPRNGAAYGVIAEMTPTRGHWAEIDAGLSRGLSLSPTDANLIGWRSLFLFATGRLHAAKQGMARAQALDPLELYTNHQLCVMRTYTGDFQGAEALVARLIAIWPEQIAGFWDRFWLLVAWKRDADAKTWLNDPSRPPDETEEYAALGRTLDALLAPTAPARRAAAAALVALGRQGVGYACNSMVLLARLGEFDQALELARGAYLDTGALRVDRSRQFIHNSRFPIHGEAETPYLFHPFLAPLRKAGRLDEIFAGVGLTEFWRAAGGPDP